MTNEQWLVYLYSIYPDGGVSIFWCLNLVLSVILIFILWIGYSDTPVEKRNTTQFMKIGKWKVIMPLFFTTMLFLSQFVPDRSTFLYIIATPYVVDSGKSIIESLQDPTSKAYKINQLLDKGLDKAIIELDKTIADKPTIK